MNPLTCRSYIKTRIRGRRWMILDQLSNSVLAKGEAWTNREAIEAARAARKLLDEKKTAS